MIRSHTVACNDCERERQTLIVCGFNVLGCVAAPNEPGFCIISFEETLEAAAMATAQADAPSEVDKGLAKTARAGRTRAASTAVSADAQAPKAAPSPVIIATARAAASPSPAASLTPTQRATCEAIVNIFETSAVRGAYGQVTLIPGDTGRLTYGRSQTTLGSGNLFKLMQTYCANPGARFAGMLQKNLPLFEDKALTLDTDTQVHNILRACADDPVMRETQDSFFDRFYFQPALRAATAMGIVSPLGVAVVYDSTVHGSWSAIRNRTNQEAGTVGKLGERAWIRAYVDQRRRWLASSPRKDLRATVYRMDAFQRLLDQNQWGLTLPLVVRGIEISTQSLAALPPGCFDGPAPGSRALSLQAPLATGLDARLLQLALSQQRMSMTADGVFGKASANAIKAFQVAHGQTATGIAQAEMVAKFANELR